MPKEKSSKLKNHNTTLYNKHKVLLEKLVREHQEQSETAHRELNEMSYILPGLGDAGDRIYGTVRS